MASDRCPSCGAAVRPGDPWCTLCWTDLRPKPAPPPPPVPAPVTAPVAAPVGAGYVPAAQTGAPGMAGPAQPAGLLTAPVDPLTAPLAAVLGQPLAADPGAPAPTWPCVECGERNALDRDTCGVCTTPFGGRIHRLDDVKAARRRYMLMGLTAVVMFLMVLAALTFAGTNATTVDSAPTDPSLENPIDYSSLPKEE